MTSDELQARLRAAVAADGPGSSDYDLNPEVDLAMDRKLRAAAVLVAVENGEDGPTVLLTKRSSKLKHHPGQISFPGGKCDKQDADAEDAALREAEEEVGLPRSAVKVLGRLPCHETVTSFEVVPVVAMIERPYSLKLETGEVEEAFHVPLSHVIDPARFRVEGRRWRGQRRYYYTAPFGPYYVWGATARILRGFAERMRQP